MRNFLFFLIFISFACELKAQVTYYNRTRNYEIPLYDETTKYKVIREDRGEILSRTTESFTVGNVKYGGAIPYVTIDERGKILKIGFESYTILKKYDCEYAVEYLCSRNDKTISMFFNEHEIGGKEYISLVYMEDNRYTEFHLSSEK